MNNVHKNQALPAFRAPLCAALCAGLCMLFPAAMLHAFTIDRVSLSGATNDFVLTPAKVEVFVDSGDTVTKELSVTNRTDDTLAFTVSVEDFEGSSGRDDTVVLLGAKQGSYSLRNFLTPEVEHFVLQPRERITFNVSVASPPDASGIGRYGAVIIASGAEDDAKETVGGARIVSRLASLFFVRVANEGEERGHVEDFRISGPARFWHFKSPLTFEVLYVNEGTVHLNPYGVIEIRNTFGRVVDELPILPYFALPDATRFQEFSWEPPAVFGRYSATLLLNRGYDDVVDERRITFIILPWENGTVALGIVAALIILAALSRFMYTRAHTARK